MAVVDSLAVALTFSQREYGGSGPGGRSMELCVLRALFVRVNENDRRKVVT